MQVASYVMKEKEQGETEVLKVSFTDWCEL